MVEPEETGHGHGHEHGHGHGQSHEQGHGHGHGHEPAGWWGRIRRAVLHVLKPHHHGTREMVDNTLEASRRGMRTLWISFGILTLTALLQASILAVTASVALLGDTIHNFADALTAVPLAIAFLLGRRAATRRFTYGLGRAEDLAGLVVLVVIAVSAVAAGWFAIERLLHPQDLGHLVWVAVAGVVGFVGNEWVARYRTRVGRQIGSAALVADGLHARTDGFTSLAVVVSAGGAALGLQWADPVVGLGITVAIAGVLYGGAREVLGRMLDGVDPDLVSSAEQALRGVPGVSGIGSVRMRWVGHALLAEVEVEVDPQLTVDAGHHIAHQAEHHLLHDLPRLDKAVVHVHPAGSLGQAHDLVAHHAAPTVA